MLNAQLVKRMTTTDSHRVFPGKKRQRIESAWFTSPGVCTNMDGGVAAAIASFVVGDFCVKLLLLIFWLFQGRKRARE